MRSRVGSLLPAVLVASLLGGSLSAARAQEGRTPELGPFFEALAPVLVSNNVFAVDAESFASILGDRLGWTVSAEDVEASLGPDFRFGRLFRFLSCESNVDCVVVEEGAHVTLAYAEQNEGPGEVELYLTLNSTEGRAVARRRESVVLRRVEGEWQVVGAGT